MVVVITSLVLVVSVSNKTEAQNDKQTKRLNELTKEKKKKTERKRERERTFERFRKN
jgi:hypothetical protein